MAESQEDPVVTLSVFVNTGKKHDIPSKIFGKWSSPTHFTLHDQDEKTYATISFRRKIKKNFSADAIRHFFDGVKIEEIAWPATLPYKKKGKRWNEPLSITDDHVVLNLRKKGASLALKDSTLLQDLLETNGLFHLQIPLECRTTKHKCLPPIFKRKHHAYITIDIDVRLMFNGDDHNDDDEEHE